MRLIRNRWAISRRLVFAGVALLVGTATPVVLGASLPAAAASSPEFAAVTTTCSGGAGSASPVIQVTLYNLPSGISLTGSATISAGAITTPLVLIGPIPSQVPDAYVFESGQSLLAFQGHPVSFSLAFNDGVGGGGSVGPQPVGVPQCDPAAPAALGASAVAIAATQTGSVYWTVTSNGFVYSYPGLGYGDLGYVPLNAPIVGTASTADGEGYWLLGADGGVFSFGDAHFYGSTGSLRLNAPVMGMAATPDGGGYWFVASDGGVFAYGDAHFYGSMEGNT